MATLQDVAARAGVSLATASRAFNGSRTRTVRPELRERVLTAARDLDYTPNAAAQAMASGRSRTISLVLTHIEDPYFSAIAAGLTRAASRAGLVVSLFTTEGDPANRLRVVDVARRQRSSALVLIGGLSSSAQVSDELSAALASYRRDTGSPVVSIGQQIPEARSIGIDDEAAAGSLARALFDQGYREALVLGGPDDHLTASRRREGFVKTFTGSGGRVTEVLSCEFTRDGGHRAMSGAAGDPLPELVFATNDVMAIGALAALREAGLRVPGDVALAGFDDISTLADITPGLTTLRIDLEELGEQAVSLVVDAEDRDRIELPTRVVLRESTPPRARG